MSTNHAEQLIKFIQESTKTTPVKVIIGASKEDIESTLNEKDLATLLPHIKENNGHIFNCGDTTTIIGDYKNIKKLLESISFDYYIENNCRNSAIPLLDLKAINARIEPGAIIRDQVTIGDRAVIMMGASINIGAIIGEGTMIDMNAVLGGRATVGKNCHIGAGTVLAGVIEPPSADPVVIEDDVVIGANAVVLEGVRIGKGSVVAAGAVVTENIPPNVVVAGTPARIIKEKDDKTISKTEIIDALREL